MAMDYADFLQMFLLLNRSWTDGRAAASYEIAS